MTKLTFRQRLFKWFTGYDFSELKAYQTVLRGSMSDDNGLNDTYLFDFKNFSSQYNQGIRAFINDTPELDINSDGDSYEGTESNNKKQPKKIAIKPKDVLAQLERVPDPFTLTLLDDKIEMLKEKSKLIVQHYSKREVDALIQRLENRKKYIENKAFFDKYQNTTDEKIDILLSKYDLVMKTSDIFIPEFPSDAIKTMTEYTEAMIKLCGKKPVFYVIAEPDKFKKAYEKRDPILLVQSPFGFFWQILGAWDEEMLLLSEL